MPCRWLRITELRGVPLHSMLPGPPSSPMGDVMQTPQFQLRRLKKQLAVERENRDELEVELAENRKLLTEKGQSLAGRPGARGNQTRLVALTFCSGFDPTTTVVMHGPSCQTLGEHSLWLWGFSAFPSRQGSSGFAVPRSVVGQGDPCPLIWTTA